MVRMVVIESACDGILNVHGFEYFTLLSLRNEPLQAIAIWIGLADAIQLDNCKVLRKRPFGRVDVGNFHRKRLMSGFEP